jgi:hypothetical protein
MNFFLCVMLVCRLFVTDYGLCNLCACIAEFLGFCSGVIEVDLLVCYIASLCGWLPTFRDRVVVNYLRV